MVLTLCFSFSLLSKMVAVLPFVGKILEATKVPSLPPSQPLDHRHHGVSLTC